MPEIEWEETTIWSPPAGSISDFCHGNKIVPPDHQNKGEVYFFIEKTAFEEMRDYLANETRREHGGILVGASWKDMEHDCYFTVIKKALPALGSSGSPVHLQFTAQSWDWISSLIEEQYPQDSIVGWFHSHPGLGVFMSGVDQNTQQAFFYQPWQVGIVCDPLARATGWFNGANCSRLSSRQVIYFQPPSDHVASEPVSILPPRRFRWLLPAFILAGMSFVVFFFVILYARDRSGSR